MKNWFFAALLLFGLIGCGGASGAVQGAAGHRTLNVETPRDERCGQSESYESIIRESADYVDEVTSRLAGRLVECEFDPMETGDQVMLAEEVAAHLRFQMMHMDRDVYDSYSDLFTEWVDKFNGVLGPLDSNEDRLDALHAQFLLTESAVWKREVQFVAQLLFDQELEPEDVANFVEKFQEARRSLDKRFQLVGHWEAWLRDAVKTNLAQMGLDLAYLTTLDPCRSLSPEFFMYVEERLPKGCQASAGGPEQTGL